MTKPEMNGWTVVSAPAASTKIAFVAWRRLSRRTTLMCKALDAELWFFPDRLPYLRAAYRTLNHVRENRPSVLLVQLPQGPLLLEALLLRVFFGCKVVADVHTGFLMQWEWKSYLLNAPFRRLLKYADHILIHNSIMNELLSEGARAKALVVYDPWQFIETVPSKQTKDEYLVFPASFHPDEPLNEVLSCFQKNYPEIKLYVTGNWRRRPSIKERESRAIVFTDYLSEAQYENLIANAKAIITGTTQEYTVLMSAWEAIAYNKPLAITESRALRETYGDYPEYYNWRDEESIRESILRINKQEKGNSQNQLLTRTEVTLKVLSKEILALIGPE